MGYTILADVIVVVHLAIVLFVLVGQLIIMAGIKWEYLAGRYLGFVWSGETSIAVDSLCRWCWVRNFWFRAVHLLTIAIVVFESVGGIECPLTTWERDLRTAAAGQPRDEVSFVGQLTHKVLFYQPPDESFFTKIYVVFGLVVLLCFLLAPPRRPFYRKYAPQRMEEHVNGQAASVGNANGPPGQQVTTPSRSG